MSDTDETPPESVKFDFSAFPADTLFYDRRTGLERRDRPAPAPPEPVAEVAPKPPRERRARKERRRRVDPTTFEKQYTDDEIEFMNAIQQFKTRTGKSFPTLRRGPPDRRQPRLSQGLPGRRRRADRRGRRRPARSSPACPI